MTTKFQHVALIGKYQAASASSSGDSTREALEAIAHFLELQGCEVSLEAETARNTGLVRYPALSVDDIGKRCDLGLVVGGDGTMLGIGRRLARYGTPLIGINQGRLGFITDIPFDAYKATLPPMLQGEYEEDFRPLMHAKVVRDERVVFDALAMNDVVVNRGATSGMVELRVEVGGRLVANQRADGLIIASPTGSTAYALSAGGPIVPPHVPCLLLAPICAHTLYARPMILGKDDVARITPRGDHRELLLTQDGQLGYELLPGDHIQVRLDPEKTVQTISLPNRTYYDLLRTKLQWGQCGFGGGGNEG